MSISTKLITVGVTVLVIGGVIADRVAARYAVREVRAAAHVYTFDDVQRAASQIEPMQIDEFTWLTGASAVAEPLSLVYHYDLDVDLTEIDMTPAEVVNDMRMTNLPLICAEKEVRYMLNHGITLTYVHTSADDQTFGWALHSSDCQEGAL